MSTTANNNKPHLQSIFPIRNSVLFLCVICDLPFISAASDLMIAK